MNSKAPLFIVVSNIILIKHEIFDLKKEMLDIVYILLSEIW